MQENQYNYTKFPIKNVQLQKINASSQNVMHWSVQDQTGWDAAKDAVLEC